MLAGRGTYSGTRIIAPATLEVMHTPQLPERVPLLLLASPMAGTLFENTCLPLPQWFAALSLTTADCQ